MVTRRPIGFTLHQLDIFAAVIRAGSFTRAAEVLLLSEPAVSRQIKLLERAVGSPLLERAPHKPVELTEAGRRLRAATERMDQQLEEALNDIDALKRADQASVSLGAGRFFPTYLLPSLYAAFHKRQPAVTVRLDSGLPSYLLEGLLQHRIDLAIMRSPPKDPALASAHLARHDHVLVGPPGHRLARGSTAPFSALCMDQLILASRESSTRGILERRARELGVELRIGWEVEGVEAQVHAVTSGLGIAVVAAYAVASHITAGTVVQLNVEGFPLRFDWCLVWPASRYSGPARALAEYLVSQRAQIEAVSLCQEPPEWTRNVGTTLSQPPGPARLAPRHSPGPVTSARLPGCTG